MPTPFFRPYPKQIPYPGADAPLQAKFDHYYSQAAGYAHQLARIDENDEDFVVIRYRVRWNAEMAVLLRQRIRLAAQDQRSAA